MGGLNKYFFSQLFDQLYELASNHHSKLPNPVDFILDEFVNLGKFTNYEEFLATCRGYGIGVATILQTFTQLQDKYSREKAESILGNCSVKICMNSANHTTAKYFSDLLGKATVKVQTSNKSSSKNTKQEGSSSSESDNEGYSARDLMTPSEISSMPDDTQLIIFSNRPPIKTKKAFQFELFPQPKQLLNQTEYIRNTNPSQNKKMDQLRKEFDEKNGDKEKEQQEKRLKEREEKKKQEELDRKEMALAESLEDLNNKDESKGSIDDIEFTTFVEE